MEQKHGVATTPAMRKKRRVIYRYFRTGFGDFGWVPRISEGRPGRGATAPLLITGLKSIRAFIRSRVIPPPFGHSE
jgi:hypothetical protein